MQTLDPSAGASQASTRSTRIPQQNPQQNPSPGSAPPSRPPDDQAPAPQPSSSAVPGIPPLPTDRAGAPLDPARCNEELERLSASERLAWGWRHFEAGLAVTTSFGIQSAVLLHMLSRLQDSGGRIAVPVIWVDTGYLPPETYHYAEQLRDRLGFELHVAQAALSPARMEALHGKLWETGELTDLELYNRLRKVEPLDQALRDLGVQCWASGVRGSQTDHRRTMAPLQPVRGLWSLRPLLNWSNRDVYYYMQEHDLPQHPLFAQGYSTVGDWHSSGPDDGGVSGRATRFGGLKQECGIHMPGLMGEGI